MFMFRVSALATVAVLSLGLAAGAQAGSSSMKSVNEIGADAGLRLGPPVFDEPAPTPPTASAGPTAPEVLPEPPKVEQPVAPALPETQYRYPSGK